ncbi:MAG: hypothetical protein ACRDU9_03355 [Acidimicrobiia bacterium]
MSVVCELAAPFVANSAVDGGPVARPFRAHTTSCLKCQARHAAMSRTARELAAMEGERFSAPADLEWRVMSSLEGDLALPRTWRKPLAWSAAAVSMAAAILIWRLRPKTS